ncbi:MAG: insulinase family protein [Alphaproteobacteria bacterium]|nr:insulinase family protein [Alphaproteobacteria bacterium]
MRTLALCFGVIAASVLALASGAARAQHFDAHSFTLANGMSGVVLPNHRAPAVTQMVWYKIGAADDPFGKSGLSHFLEHLMFKGTRAVPPGAFSAKIAENGGRDNAFTTEDYTAFHETVARDRLGMVMGLEADRMTGLALTDDVVLPERDVVLEERHMRIDDDPAALLAEQLRATLFLNDRYRIPTIGWEVEIRKLGTADALAFYREWYAPNNAILVVAGDVEDAEVRSLAEQYFAPVARHPVPQRVRPIEPEHHAAARLEMKSPRAAQPSWRRLYVAPSYRTGDVQHAYPLQVLAEILGDGASSRLYRSLVLDRGLALSVEVSYEPSAINLATFDIYATPKAGVAVPQLEAAIDAELRQIVEHGADADEVSRAEARMQASSVYDRDSLTGPAEIIGAALAIGQSIDDVEAWPERIGQVTPDEVTAAARAVLIERNSATGILLPEHTS